MSALRNWVRRNILRRYDPTNPLFKTASPKMEIIGLLAAKYGFRRYLELCSSVSGNYYRNLDRRILSTAHRLMYNCPEAFADGLNIDFRSENLDISQCLAEIRGKGFRYDIILVDPFHEYDSSYRDLHEALDLIDEGGMLVVHDCLPPRAKVATPRQLPGEWPGVTYKAYLDFISERRDLEYTTVDVDYGCGLIRKSSSELQINARHDSLLWQDWREIGNDFNRTFRFLKRHKKELLNLISVEEFFGMLKANSAEELQQRPNIVEPTAYYSRAVRF